MFTNSNFEQCTIFFLIKIYFVVPTSGIPRIQTSFGEIGQEEEISLETWDSAGVIMALLWLCLLAFGGPALGRVRGLAWYRVYLAAVKDPF